MANNRNQMMHQYRKMQEQIMAAQEQAEQLEASASAGGGAVKVTATGKMRVTSLTIDPAALDPDDVELLQDMIMAAVNEALDAAEGKAAQQLSSAAGGLTGGLNIPGLF